ncbi:MAG: hypothetical protein HY289_07345 [Planctomycetes bacterium]|nr:hypothetical protein [Planctomycetota bacterium]
MKQQRVCATKLPRTLRPFFWDYDFARLSWEADRDLIIARILAVGDWASLRWLRRRFPDNELRAWLIRRRGAGLSNRHLRFWELILDLPRRQVNAWLADPARQIWEGRNRE